VRFASDSFQREKLDTLNAIVATINA
jgi:hypothetical protein